MHLNPNNFIYIVLYMNIIVRTNWNMLLKYFLNVKDTRCKNI